MHSWLHELSSAGYKVPPASPSHNPPLPAQLMSFFFPRHFIHTHMLVSCFADMLSIKFQSHTAASSRS